MKKIYLTLGLGALLFGANAQQLKLGKAITKKTPIAARINSPASTYSITVDTLLPSSIMTGGCAATGTALALTYYAAGVTANADSGYVFGSQVSPSFTTAGTGTTVVTVTVNLVEVAQRYSVGTSSATVTNVLVFPGVGAGSATTTTANIYAEAAVTGTGTNVAGGNPGNLLGKSQPLPMSSYSAALSSTGSGVVSYSFATAVPVAANSNFYAAITIPAIGGTDKDTLVPLNTNAGCSSTPTDSLSWIYQSYVATGYAPQKFWGSVKNLYGSSNNLDFMIFPVIDMGSAAGIENYVSHGALTIYAASPNPTNSSININFSVATSANVGIEIYDITGKVVKSISNNSFASGKNSINVDVTNLEAGTYMYSVNANGNRMFSKFIVTK
jgi:type IX secretion system substrate protein